MPLTHQTSLVTLSTTSRGTVKLLRCDKLSNRSHMRQKSLWLLEVFTYYLIVAHKLWNIKKIILLLKTKLSSCPIFTRGQLWPSGIVVACVCLCVCVCVYVCVRQSSGCPDDNLSPAQATITKFGPEVQNTLIKIPIVFGVHWPWPSRSNLT